MTPYQYGNIFRELRQRVPATENIRLSCHCHDDLGMAVANSLAAVEGGATQVEGTINGIGERAGNAALEEVALALERPLPVTLAVDAVEHDDIQIGDRVSAALEDADMVLLNAGLQSGRIIRRSHDVKLIVHDIVGVDSKALFHEFILGFASMHKQHVGITVFTQFDGLSSADSNDLHFDTTLLLKYGE